jgi:signal transduction histidine kinase
MVRHRRAGANWSAPKGGTIGGRLIRILALPVLAVLILLGVVVVGDVNQYRTAKATRDSVNFALSTQDFIQDLQVERGLTAGLLAGGQNFKSDLPVSRGKVDTQRISLAQQAATHVTGADAVRAALAQLADLSAIRVQVDTNKISRSTALAYFTVRITALNSVNFGLDSSSDPTLRTGYTTWFHVGQTKEYAAQEQAIVNGVLSAGGFKDGEFAQYALIRANTILAQSQSVAYLTEQERQAAAKLQASSASTQAAAIDAVVSGAADGRALHIDPRSWWSAMSTLIDNIRALQQVIGTDIQHQAQDLENGATRRLSILGGLVVGCLVGAVVLLIVAARSITRPLARLAAEANALAVHRLPEAVARLQSATEDDHPPPSPVRVPRRASTEILSVAEALDRVQATAYTLATEQAMLRRTTTESLANLGRRNQNLLRRQIGFITKLEQEESDPSGLANLFELDHLATRMRRNAESLLVLVGEASPRSWSEPLPVTDVVRAAVSEVEEYRRVSLRRIDDAYVNGSYVTGLAHMIAELVENGLAFSPPDADVEIQGRHLGNRYLIAVTDQGVGMTAGELARANARLHGEESYLNAPTRYLGHYVVGHLARQMNVEVELNRSPVTGITARIMLPASVLTVPGTIANAGIPSTAVSALATGPVSTVPRGGRPAPGDAPTTSPRRIPAPRTPEPVVSYRAIDARPAPEVEYITVAEPGPAVTTPTPPGDPREAFDSPVPANAHRSVPDQATDAGRTRNGLVKRPPRARTTTDAAPAAAPADQPPALDESPDHVRDRMMSLRAGIVRGEQHGTKGNR